jgi:hypothetical protein
LEKLALQRFADLEGIVDGKGATAREFTAPGRF